MTRLLRVDDDVAVAHTSDLGVPVTTDPEEIAAFLRQRSGPRVVFATYQSSPQIEAAFKLGRVPGFDLVIADEAHRCAGLAWSDFATILDPAAIKTKRRLFSGKYADVRPARPVSRPPHARQRALIEQPRDRQPKPVAQPRLVRPAD